MAGLTHLRGKAEQVAPARPGRLRRWLAGPLLAQLAQGVSPEQIARTLAIGTVCSLFPFLGATSALNFLVGVALRMNLPLLQALNLVLGPVQLLMILVYVRAGEWVWRAPGEPFSVTGMIRAFGEISVSDFLARFGLAGWHAFTAWLLTAPVVAGLVYSAGRPFVRKLRIQPFGTRGMRP